MRHARHIQTMNKTIIIVLLLTLILPSCGQNEKKLVSADKGRIKVTWTNKLSGDFSFTNNWSYPEGIYKNKYGQLVCDGFCPDESFSMKDSTGRIFQDSIKAYYQLIDTTHLFHSIDGEAWCYEWAGTDYIKAQLLKGDTIKCETLTNVGTHSSLNLIITGNTCIPTIELYSVAAPDKKVYYCSEGYINIEKGSLEDGILKTQFSFNFYHPEDPKIIMFWKGIAMTTIEK